MAAIAETRAKAELQVKAARQEIEKEAAAAKSGLQAQAESLAAEIIRVVLNVKGTQQAPAANAQ